MLRLITTDAPENAYEARSMTLLQVHATTALVAEIERRAELAGVSPAAMADVLIRWAAVYAPDDPSKLNEDPRATSAGTPAVR